MGRATVGLAVLALLPALGGCCASFRAGNIECPQSWPPGPPAEAAMLRSVSIAFQAVATSDAREEPFRPYTGLILGNATHLAYLKAARFTNVRRAPELADLRVGARLAKRHACSPVGLRVAHALTFGLVPAWERDGWTLSTTVADADGKVLGRIEKSEAVNTWRHLLLILVFPFAPPQGVAAECVLDLNRATISQAVAQGIY